jgi:glycosyltransferase involved in cell wall biosynthesis
VPLRLTFFAVHDAALGAQKGEWISYVGDPQFELVLPTGSIEDRNVVLTFRSQGVRPRWVNPIFYFDDGSGYRGNAVASPRFIEQLGGLLFVGFQLPKKTVKIRFDPTAKSGDFGFTLDCALSTSVFYFQLCLFGSRLLNRCLRGAPFERFIAGYKSFRNDSFSVFAFKLFRRLSVIPANSSLTAATNLFAPAMPSDAFQQELHRFLHTKSPEYIALPASNRPARVRSKVLAFYLTQFHPIKENDAWWGRGFTEWTNVTKATPKFVGHYQPHLPGELGFYDLRLPEIMRRQAELARLHGIAGFCFYYYWFGGQKLLEKPLQNFLSDRSIDAEFVLCWANETWSRRWDGAEHEVLLQQTHSEKDDIDMIADVIPAFRDSRYLRVDGKPVFIVYRVGIMPEPSVTANRWREYCRRQGIGEIHLVAARTFGLTDPTPHGFDASMEFPPHEAKSPSIHQEQQFFVPSHPGGIFNYDYARDSRLEAIKLESFPVYRAAMVSWDNSARRGISGHVYQGSCPQSFYKWIRALSEAAVANPHQAPISFVNAWNEWAEGAHLEPDRFFGYGYLAACRRALAIPEENLVSVVIPTFGHEKYIEKCLESVLKQRNTNIEIIVVDDCSPDRTEIVARKYLEKHARSVKWQYHRLSENVDAPRAINTGVALANGRWIAILNSDDQWHPSRLEIMLDECKTSGADLAFSQVRKFADDEDLSWQAEPIRSRKVTQSIMQLPELLPLLLRENIAVSTGNFVFRREVFDAVGGFSTLRLCHDWRFVLNATKRFNVISVQAPLYWYRHHATNTFSKLNEYAVPESSLILNEFFADFDHHPHFAECVRSEGFASLVNEGKYDTFMSAEVLATVRAAMRE